MAEGLREAGVAVEEIEAELCPALTMDSTEDEIVRRRQVRVEPRSHSSSTLASRRSVDPVRRQFESRAAGADRCRAGLEGAEVGEARPPVQPDRRGRSSSPSRSAPPAAERRRRRAAKDTLTRQSREEGCEAIYKELVRRKIAVDKRRPDGRGTDEIRPITCEVDVAPRTHGSALFTRGQTQIMTLLTLGTAKEGQRIDDLSLEQERRFMHHYNFPPFSVGETGLHARARSAATSATATSRSARSSR